MQLQCLVLAPCGTLLEYINSLLPEFDGVTEVVHRFLISMYVL